MTREFVLNVTSHISSSSFSPQTKATLNVYELWNVLNYKSEKYKYFLIVHYVYTVSVPSATQSKNLSVIDRPKRVVIWIVLKF